MNMKRIFRRKEACCGCNACAEVCPAGAIIMKEDGEGFSYPKLNRKKCIGCGLCAEVCPIKREAAAIADYVVKPEGKGQDNAAAGRVYMGAQAKADRIRYESSSGGVFPVLAGYALEKKGVVFGAVMEEDGVVRHKMARAMEELAPMQKTKYVQSSLEGCFESVRKCLKEGRFVLFTGTPCQCRAMRLYLERGSRKAGEGAAVCENLLLADLVCYGAPSPGIWRKYLKEMEKRHGGKLSGFCFRDKRKKDDGHTVSFFVGEKEYAYSMREDSFCRVYFRDYTLRPACYSCPYCTTERESDITIGDFWGIEKLKPEMADGMGTSLVILHSDKAKKIWEEVEKDFRYFQCEREDVLQPRLLRPAAWPGRRWRFMLLNKFLPVSISEKILRK